MNGDKGRASSARKWWLLIGGIVVFVVGFSLIENLVRKEPRPSVSAEDTADVFSHAAPRLRRLDDGAIEIRHDLFRHTTIRLEDEEAGQALFDCLAQGIERTFGDGVEGWDGERIRRETRRIQDECMSLHGVSVPVPLPPAGAGERH